MGGSVTSRTLEMHRLLKLARGADFPNHVARLVSDRAHSHAPAAELEHLRHEGHAVGSLAARVQRREYLFLAADLDPIAFPEPR